MSEIAPEDGQNDDVKRYRRGTHRIRVPEQTCREVEPHRRALGITRVANVTGLDRVGIPVVLAVRPNARSLAVAQGKGVDLAAARASALMESLELWHAEHLELPMRRASARALAARGHRPVDVSRLAAVVDADHDEVEMFWVPGCCVRDRREVWVPVECVSADFTLPMLPGCGRFAASTNGLASGNSRDEALVHALTEAIERDAEALWRLGGRRAQMHTGVDLESIRDPLGRELLERLERAGIRVWLWDLTSDVGIACVLALAVGEASDWADPEFGAGCHPDRDVALVRALSEAAQARITFIAGSRDDLGDDLYLPERRAERRRACLQIADAHRPRRDFSALPTRSTDRIGDDLDWVLERLANVGVDDAVMVDLSRPELPVSVVRAVVPGLEGPLGHAHCDYLPGERGRRILSDLSRP